MKLYEALHLLKTERIKGIHYRLSQVKYMYDPETKHLIQMEKKNNKIIQRFLFTGFSKHVNQTSREEDCWEATDESL